MVYSYEFNRHTAHLNCFSRSGNIQVYLSLKTVFTKLSFNKSQCKLCSVNRHIYLFKEIGKSADMVFMSVSKNDTTKFFLVFLNICEIRKNDVNTRHFRIRESHSAVDDKHIVTAFYNCHILSDFIKSSERNYSDRSSSDFSFRLFVSCLFTLF